MYTKRMAGIDGCLLTTMPFSLEIMLQKVISNNNYVGAFTVVSLLHGIINYSSSFKVIPLVILLPCLMYKASVMQLESGAK